MTDGEENSSREWTLHAIRELIKSKEAAPTAWTFVFSAARRQSRRLQGASLGVPMANAVPLRSTTNYRGVYASLAKSTNVFSADAARAAGASKETPRASKSLEGTCGSLEAAFFRALLLSFGL